MAKLPVDFTADDIHEKTLRYTDAVELLADMRRVRQRLGWVAYWAGADDTQKRFRFHLYDLQASQGEDPDSPYRSCGFEILGEAIYQNLWPSLYPDNKDVPVLRRLFVDTKGGAHKVAEMVNETPKAVEASGPGQSALDMLLDDDE